MRKLRTLLLTYGQAGGADAVVLLHDADHGGALIDALARSYDGLPANVLPLAVNEATQVGLEAVAAAFAYGASAVRFLLRARPHHDMTGLRRTFAWPSRSCTASASGASAWPPSRRMTRRPSAPRSAPSSP